MEEGEISTDTELAPSVLEVPTINWANYIGVKSVQYIKMGHAPKVQALEQNNWDLKKNRPRNGKRIRHRITTADDGDNQRPQIIKNTRLFGTPAV